MTSHELPSKNPKGEEWTVKELKAIQKEVDALMMFPIQTKPKESNTHTSPELNIKGKS